jgi:anti-anti-sigma regulatory factor
MIAIASETLPSSLILQIESHASRRSRNILRQSVTEALTRGVRRVVIDCAAWCEFDLLLVSAMVHCAKECEASAATFELVNVDHQISARIRALRLSEAFSV